MKIAHINRIWGAQGGVEQYLMNLVSDLKHHGHESIVLYSNKSYINNFVEDIESYKVNGIDKYNNSDLNSIQRILEDINPDIIFFHNTPNYHLIKFVTDNWPSVRMIHDHELYCWRPSRMLRPTHRICQRPFNAGCLFFGCAFTYKSRRKLKVELRKFKLKIAELKATQKIPMIIVASDYMRGELLRNNFELDQIKVLPCYSIPPKIRDLEREKNRIILFVGRIIECKGLAHLLKAFAKLDKNCLLIVIGDGPYLSKAKTISNDLNAANRVKFLGRVENNELPEYYAAAEFVVVPSLWPEPFGIVGIEAMSNATPIIAYDTGGIKDWLENGVNGYLVPRGNINKLANAMEKLLSNPLKSKEMGIKGRNLFERKYTADIYVKLIIKAFKEAIYVYKTQDKKISI